MYKSGSTARPNIICEYSNYIFFAPTKINIEREKRKLIVLQRKRKFDDCKEMSNPIRMIIRIQYLLNHGVISGSI